MIRFNTVNLTIQFKFFSLNIEIFSLRSFSCLSVLCFYSKRSNFNARKGGPVHKDTVKGALSFVVGLILDFDGKTLILTWILAEFAKGPWV